ncbi:sulfurtransferase [Winogradskyella sp.]|uniref:sulfurtransferase n=1 Tax=Winogradskyella sp. TaxID=1883156 RepID=UPI0025E0DC2F|nr:sulfurtransferase [Winogradskyella sp.]
MNWRISFIGIALFLLSCQQEKTVKNDVSETIYLIEPLDLLNIVNDHNIKILDFRKKEFYVKEHIVGAINIWRTDIEDKLFLYSGVMASKTQIETLFGKLGIKTNDTIIVYDDNGLCEATRLWWILQYYDFKNIKLLNGGLPEWKANNGQVTSEISELSESVFKLSNNTMKQYYISKEEVEEALYRNMIILDTRTADEFSGRRQKKGASKGGRIPNSIHIDWAKAINYDSDKRLKSVKDLDSIYNTLNIKKNDSLIVYCHSGVRSAHTTFVLTQILGYKNVRNYDGSWIEWSYFNDLPFKKDSITKNIN